MPAFPSDAIDAALAERDAAAFLHAGRTDEPTLRYCAGPLPDGEAAVVYADGRATLCVPTELEAAAGANARAIDAPVGKAAVAVLDELGVDGTVLTPRNVPHDAALYAENAGFELASTAAVERARAVKSAAERERIADAQGAAVAGVERAREALRAASVADGELRRDGDPLTARALREAVDAAVRSNGASPANDTGVTVGSGERAPDAPIAAGETVVVRVAPREPGGYRGALARTFVVEGEGGWERRAQLAVERAMDSVYRELEAGVAASTIREEVLVECGAYGFADDALPETAGHGVGLAVRERPDLRSDDPLPAGTVLAITPAVTDPDGGAVALTDLVAVTEDGYESLGTTDRSLRP
ncbi:M24 family metallopeptidase [Halostella sp. JP-L12]|uniref:M24 family metallopeptidase n=1 Tax=Halostella TaxID=1843185 RepID=UPI000EF7E179|nr:MULTISPECIES: M24 family metallopeptidase [Halostella]NHN48194.1 M24 family metallopeptidase [Halostella sp. JP-L12]